MDENENWAFYTLSIGVVAVKQDGEIITAVCMASQLHEEYINRPTKLTNQVAAELEDYLLGVRTTFSFDYQGEGTLFQKRVWAELCKIPYGKTCSYKEVAIALGVPNAARAVGAANRKNPLLIVVPCHRVIGSAGKLTGYVAGVELKKKLLALESQHL
ncbi:MAG: methylated-DNA--[protein]-cysteine S-methyltransferase [Phocaeicola sp.]